MLIKRNLPAETAMWFVVISIIPAGMLIRRPGDWIWAAVLEGIALVIFSGLRMTLKEREIIYASDAKQITIAGSKEGLHDPDTILRTDISKASLRGSSIDIEMNDGHVIVIAVSAKHRSAVLDDLNKPTAAIEQN